MEVLDTLLPVRSDCTSVAEPHLLLHAGPRSGKKILTLFGTRPEIIKLAPVLQELEVRDDLFQTVNVTSAQHTDLLYPFIRLFDIRVDYDLQIMRTDQTPRQVCRRVLAGLHPLLTRERPDLVLVQGDTTTALAGALAGVHHSIPVGHVEAGLRSGNLYRPYPEEINRRLITRLATYHFAATPGNRDNLLAEKVPAERIFVTGNPVVDALEAMLQRYAAVLAAAESLNLTPGLKRVVVTTHRRESFGETLMHNLRVLRRFVEDHPDIVLLFPVHPNPAVQTAARAVLSGHPRIELLAPLDYVDFIGLLRSAWLIVSDSGGIQEEALTLGKSLLILRDHTERPEALAAGGARLVGAQPQRLADLLQEVYRHGPWTDTTGTAPNPFGDGNARWRIVQAIAESLTGELIRTNTR